MFQFNFCLRYWNGLIFGKIELSQADYAMQSFADEKNCYQFRGAILVDNHTWITDEYPEVGKPCGLLICDSREKNHTRMLQLELPHIANIDQHEWAAIRWLNTNWRWAGEFPRRFKGIQFHELHSMEKNKDLYL